MIDLKLQPTKEVKMKTIYMLFFTGLLLSGCSTHTATNQLIADANANRLKEFAAGMKACGDNAACQVAVSMAFAGNMGQQQFYREDSVTDYMKAFLPYAALGVDITRLFRTTTSGDSAGFVVTGDNNTISGGNKLTADNNSTLSGAFETTSSITHQAWTLDNAASYAPDESVKTELAPEPVIEEEPVVVE